MHNYKILPLLIIYRLYKSHFLTMYHQLSVIYKLFHNWCWGHKSKETSDASFRKTRRKKEHRTEMNRRLWYLYRYVRAMSWRHREKILDDFIKCLYIGWENVGVLCNSVFSWCVIAPITNMLFDEFHKEAKWKE